VPTVAVAGSPVRSGFMSAPVMASVVDAVLFDALTSLVALEVPLNVRLATGVVGVPATVQVMTPPGASGEAVGTVGEQLVVRLAGTPLMAQVAAVAATAGEAALVHVNVLE
jgi:hypothetical protein